MGINTVTKDTFNESATAQRVSIFPLNIPYCTLASSSVIIFFKNLTTVKESIFLLSEEIILLKDIGIATLSIEFFLFLLAYN